MANSKYLFVRLDRIGDLVLTLPSDQVLSSADVTWAISKNLDFLAKASVPPRKTLLLEKQFQPGFRSLVEWIKKEQPQGIIIFNGPWWVYFAAFIYRIPLRGGVKSRWYSFLFLNRGIRQKRSLSQKNELDYNLDLVQSVLQIKSQENTPPLRIEADQNTSKTFAHRFGLVPLSYVIIHPGMGGSAENWPLEKWETLIRKAVLKFSVVITGTSIDESWLFPLKKKLADLPQIHWLDEKLNANELLSAMKGASAVVAPSTGVVHLAASLGVKTIGIYSPVRVQAPKRWGPLGPQVSVHVPQVSCPGHFKCHMQECQYYNCMDQISVESVLAQIGVPGELSV